MAPQPESDILTGFKLLEQRQRNWCWASVGVALAKYFHDRALTQCGLANSVIDPPDIDCCQSPGDPACNAIQLMSNVLRKIEVPRRASPAQPERADNFTFDLVKDEIAKDLPVVCLLIGGEGDHHVVVVGWSIPNGIPTLHVDDPAVGRRVKIGFIDFFRFGGRQLHQFTRLA